MGHQCKNHELHVPLVFDDKMEGDNRKEEARQVKVRLEVAGTIELSWSLRVGLTTLGKMRAVIKEKQHEGLRT